MRRNFLIGEQWIHVILLFSWNNSFNMRYSWIGWNVSNLKLCFQYQPPADFKGNCFTMKIRVDINVNYTYLNISTKVNTFDRLGIWSEWLFHFLCCRTWVWIIIVDFLFFAFRFRYNEQTDFTHDCIIFYRPEYSFNV